MTFTLNIPQSGQSLGQTRDAVRNNFTNYNNLVSVNHVAPNSAGQGKHTFAEFVVQANSPATAASEVALYSRTLNGVPQLCLQKQSQAGSAADIQMSRVDVGALASGNGYSFLPGGVVIQWGSVSAPSTSQPFTFPVAFPTAVFQVVVSGDGAGNTDRSLYVKTTSITTSGFTANSFGTFDVIRYIAIGN